MFSNIFKSNTPDTKKESVEESNKINLSEQDTQEKSGDNINSNSNNLIINIAKELEDRLKLENLKLSTENEILSEKLFKIFFEEKLRNWRYSNLKDEFRPEYANKSTGGIDLKNKEHVSMLRGIGYDIIKQIGKKILSGDFNLTTVSFPIKVMLPLTILQSVAKTMFQFPIYMNIAVNQSDPLEKIKFVITATIAGFHSSLLWLKPLNPILGETFEMYYEDGSHVYLEQTSHHPPVSHFLIYGPNNNYKIYGYSNFTSGAGLNSLKVSIKNFNLFLIFSNFSIF
jgi:hypothetical protein